MKFKERVATTFLFMAILGIFGMSFIVGRGLETKVSAETDGYEELKVFTEVLSALQKNYVEPVDNKDLVYGAIKGMLNTLDAHSTFMPAEIYKEMQVDTKGEFGGLGLQIGIKENKLVVVAPIEGTPAEEAGYGIQARASRIVCSASSYFRPPRTEPPFWFESYPSRKGARCD
ncbi:MAG: S41 family peptidase [Nitrospiria bacterium]